MILSHFIFCHIKGAGFVGVGICESSIKKASEFNIIGNGVEKNIMDCNWINNDAKESINPEEEFFLPVKWIYTVPKEQGYWKKEMVSLPMVAYQMNDETTHNIVLKHFNIEL